MSVPSIAFAGLILALTGCATSHAGWTGTNAQPFDAALASCQAQVAAIADEWQREAALRQCMAPKGWTRPN